MQIPASNDAQTVTPTSRAERSEALRRRIVASALETFSTHGSSMSLSTVAQGAEISKQLLLYHFKNKATLEEAVLELLISRSHHDMSGFVTASLISEEAGLATLQERFLDDPEAAVQGSRAMLRFLLDGTPEQQLRIHEGTRAWFDGLVEELRAGQAEGRIRRGIDAEAVIPLIGNLLLTSMTQLLLQSGWSGRTVDDWQHVRLVELVRSIRSILLPG
ncbi:MAG TPA: TetR/AcrR family transcriptional regulator [Myxococcaceae bacterium]|nr:TetR/AcrR family transcriptional regulator [Myxococcaceae bacterium]